MTCTPQQCCCSEQLQTNVTSVKAITTCHTFHTASFCAVSNSPSVLQASMASGAVDVCLIPEVRFDLEGEQGMLAYVRRVLQRQGHCVICVAEGAGQVRRSLHRPSTCFTHHYGTTVWRPAGPALV